METVGNATYSNHESFVLSVATKEAQKLTSCLEVSIPGMQGDPGLPEMICSAGVSETSEKHAEINRINHVPMHATALSVPNTSGARSFGDLPRLGLAFEEAVLLSRNSLEKYQSLEELQKNFDATSGRSRALVECTNSKNESEIVLVVAGQEFQSLVCMTSVPSLLFVVSFINVWLQLKYLEPYMVPLTGLQTKK